MSYVVHHPIQYVGEKVVGEGENVGQCAQLAQLKWAEQHKQDMPSTDLWTNGKRLIDCKPGELTPGTVLATFDHMGNYHNKHGYHTVIFVKLTPDSNGRPSSMEVIHQYANIGPVIKKETFFFGPNRDHYKDARNYCVVERKGDVSGKR